LKNPAFQNLPAIKENHVKPLPAAYLYTMNQHIGEAMLAIMYTVYPQLERNSHD
ncbi:ABC transporter substrate-binding protein, partial [Salmonella enterica subsp. enterica]|nr:ABC transporter substrate-binding protein [Salmonella enterica subsp. enterica serovar Typhimurium]